MTTIATRGAHVAPRVGRLAVTAVAAILLMLAVTAVLTSIPRDAATAAPARANDAPARANDAPARANDVLALVASLQRTVRTATAETRLLIATPAYLRATHQEDIGVAYGADRDLLLLISEDVHTGDLPAFAAPVLLRDGRPIAAAQADVVMEASHHRAVAAVYRLGVPAASLRVVEALVPGVTEPVRWEDPYGTAPSGAAPSAPALLALFGGLLASMWPCLFQLSAYFIPSVAGLSLAETESGAQRAPVLRTAILFVSGIVIVYTLAGAAAGYAAQTLGGNALFDSARGPVTFLAGLVVLAMAARIAVQARAPLVCKMPVLGMAGRFGNGPIGTIALGLAFATGCMTCFGAALVLGLFAYVVTTASVLTGAVILFLFSLGIAVPLVLAAVAMARVLPLLGHLERNARYLSLASAAIMTVYAAMLLTGSTHVLSDAVAAIGAVRR